MTFASLLPLIMLVGVPVIIILYLMKPKGTRKVVPSLLLWKNAERNDQSMTFSKKLINNILMILEILTLIFLVLAAMSPAIKRGMTGSTKSTILVIDTSGSMSQLYKNGVVQETLERLLPIAMQFDDDGQMEVWSFDTSPKRLPSVSINNIYGYIDTYLPYNRIYGGTDYGAAIDDIVRKFIDEEPAKLPTYVIFITPYDPFGKGLMLYTVRNGCIEEPSRGIRLEWSAVHFQR